MEARHQDALCPDASLSSTRPAFRLESTSGIGGPMGARVDDPSFNRGVNMRFIHAADIHLDSPLHGLSAYADAPAAMLRNSTREAFSSLVATAIDESVDFVVIAGDLYDGTWRDHNT
ncbi:conserved hypothetical protein, partial [Ricinus communis]